MIRKEEEVAKKLEKEHQKMLKRIAQEARQREIETAEKMEANRKKTEALLEGQAQVAEQNRLTMLEKEAKVREQLALKKASLAQAIADKKAAAEKRIAEAMEKHHELHELKKRDFDVREQAAVKRYKEKEVEERDKLKKQAQAREKKNTTRITRLIDAYRTRSDHRDDIVSKRSEKDKVYGVIQIEREKELSLRKFDSQLRKDDKQSNIERQARVNEYNRLQTLSRIYDEDMKYAAIKKQRSDLLSAQRAEVKDSLNRKHEIAFAMEQMKITNDFSMLQKVMEKQKNANNKGKVRASTSHGADAHDALGETHGGEDERLNQTH